MELPYNSKQIHKFIDLILSYNTSVNSILIVISLIQGLIILDVRE